MSTYALQSKPFTFSNGPHTAKIALVGEAWGEKEERFHSPFVGASGIELARMCGQAGLCRNFSQSWASELTMIAHWHASPLFLTNAFTARPAFNKLHDEWCVGKAEAGADYPMPMLDTGKYIKRELLFHVERLHEELNQVKPNLIVALGNVAAWALLGRGRITSIRGTITTSKYLNCKVLPTFHPAAVLRNWSLRPIVIMDLLKANREMEFSEIRRPERWVTVSPTLGEIEEWFKRPAQRYAVDIETLAGQITMVGFARSSSDALVVPFWTQGGSYWPTADDEAQAWRRVKQALETPIPKVFQNGLYDLSYLVKMGIRPRNCDEDTMLLHHSLYPELQKGLGFMGSIYTNEAAWKIMRSDMNKREE